MKKETLKDRTVVLSLRREHWELLDRLTQSRKCSMRDLMSSIVREVCQDDLEHHAETKQELQQERYQ